MRPLVKMIGCIGVIIAMVCSSYIIALSSAVESSAIDEEIHWCKCPGNELPVGCGEAECPDGFYLSGSGICGGKQGDCWNQAMPIEFRRFECPENLEVCGSIQ